MITALIYMITLRLFEKKQEIFVYGIGINVDTLLLVVSLSIMIITFILDFILFPIEIIIYIILKLFRYKKERRLYK